MYKQNQKLIPLIEQTKYSFEIILVTLIYYFVKNRSKTITSKSLRIPISTVITWINGRTRLSRHIVDRYDLQHCDVDELSNRIKPFMMEKIKLSIQYHFAITPEL